MATAKYEMILSNAIEELTHLQEEADAVKEKMDALKATALELMDKHDLVKHTSPSGRTINLIRSTDTIIDPEAFSKMLPLEHFLKCVKVSVSAARKYVGEIALQPISEEKPKKPYVTLKAGK